MENEPFDESMLEIIEVREGEDGSANITIDVSDEFIAAYKLKTGKKRATKKGITKYIEDHLRKELLEKVKKDV
tara:strand:- start:144 stop:362 length:219 start_codon:yes stop_codon:yes gene_type:complete